MPVEIRLEPRFQLRTTSDNILELPVIELAPVADSQPHLSRISFSVRGTPPDLADLIQSVYPPYSTSTPYKLQIGQQLRQAICRLDLPLPANVNCTLQVSVEYFDSDDEGNPNLAEKHRRFLPSIVRCA